MTNLIEDLRQEIKSVVMKSLEIAAKQGELPQMEVNDITVESPREKEHGDFSTNIAMQVTKQAHRAPRQIAEIIIKNLILDGTYIDKVECAGPGFINFYLKNNWLMDTLKAIQNSRRSLGHY